MIVTTPSGELEGLHDPDSGVLSFRGVPYAEPTSGPDRWRPPRRVVGWTGVRPALEFGDDCPQPAPVAGGRSRAPRQSEDCLNLNVWTPAVDAPLRPVMVWFPGGGFVTGSGADALTDGTSLAAHGVVIVTCNYRLGLFGYLAHPALSSESPEATSGNYGLLDQIAALEWVRDNIAAFGGDPSNVTVFGCSAGAASIALLMTSPRGKGRFHKAILQSPGAFRRLATLDVAEEAGRTLGNSIDELRARPAGDIVAMASQLQPARRSLTGPRVLRPICDGVIVPSDDRPVFESGDAARVPVITGNVADEGTWATHGWGIDTFDDLAEFVRADFGPAADDVLERYAGGGVRSPAATIAALFGDTQFNLGGRGVARTMSAIEPHAYRYVFSRRRPDHTVPGHTAEVAYVFGTLDTDGADGVVDADHRLSAAVQRAWTQFARTGDPNGAGIDWPAYREATDPHLVLDDPVRASSGWRTRELAYLEKLLAEPLDRPDEHGERA